MRTYVPAHLYIHQGADHSLPYPAEGYGGWTGVAVPLDPEKTAVLVMHAWEILPYSECPAIHRMCEYIPRAQEIMDTRFPDFLEAVRKSGVRLIHVGSATEKTLQFHPRYQELSRKYPPKEYPQVEKDQELLDFHWRLASCDESNEEGFWKSVRERDFYIKPPADEDVVCTTQQLFELCREEGINHLIYTGFASNWCLLFNECGVIDMNRHGLLCSIVGDLTTAVENKESCRTQEHLKYSMWLFSNYNGFVFLADDLKRTLLCPEKP